MIIEEIALPRIDGGQTTLAEYAGQVQMIVNVASRCGLAPQYRKLQELQERYGDRGFTVLAFPSNQFRQELGSDEAVQEYCRTTWNVGFPVFARIRVNGRHRHPLYTELTKVADAGGHTGRIRWNFEKFLRTPDGTITRYRPRMEPDDPAIVETIERALPAR